MFQSHRRFWAGFAVFIFSFYFVAATAPDPGLTWDEAIYLGQAVGYINRARVAADEGISQESIRRDWQVAIQREDAPPLIAPSEDNPPFGKVVTAVSLSLFSGMFDPLLAARLGAALCFALTCMAIFIFLEKRFGFLAALLAVAALMLTPRVFGHSRLATLEMPLLLMWTMTVIAFAKGIDSRTWSVLAGVFFALAMLTKLNAVLLLPPLMAWGIIFFRRKALWNVLSLAVVSPIVFFIGWPAFWLNPFRVTMGFLYRTTQRMFIPTWYFSLPEPAWHYPLVMALLTAPLLLIVLAVVGFHRGCFDAEKKRADRRRTLWLALMVCVVPLLLACLPGVPKYDGVRHILPVFAFLAAGAGAGAAMVWEQMRSWKRSNLRLLIAVAAAVWLALPVVMFHPFHLSYYNELAGGPWGARAMGLEITYWGEGFDDRALDFIEHELPYGGRVALGAVGEMVADMHRAMGSWPENVEITNYERGDWDLLVVVPRPGWLVTYQPDVMDYFVEKEPIWKAHMDPFKKIPVCLIYSRAE